MDPIRIDRKIIFLPLSRMRELACSPGRREGVLGENVYTKMHPRMGCAGLHCTMKNALEMRPAPPFGVLLCVYIASQDAFSAAWATRQLSHSGESKNLLPTSH